MAERQTRLTTILHTAPLAKNQFAFLVAELTMTYEFTKQVLDNSGSATTNLVKHNIGYNFARSDATTPWYTMGVMRNVLS